MRSRSDGPEDAVEVGDSEGVVEAAGVADDGGDPDGTAAVGAGDAVALDDGTAGEPHAARNRPTPPSALARRNARREIVESDGSGAAGGRRRLMASAYGPRPFDAEAGPAGRPQAPYVSSRSGTGGVSRGARGKATRSSRTSVLRRT